MTYNPLVLAIETSSRIGSVAVAVGKNILAEKTFSAPIRHSAEIFPAISDILERFNKKPDKIEQIYISAGPGSFTGLRIAVTIAKTMHLANSANIIAVDTLDVIAANANDYTKESQKKIAAILDAKRGQFFIAVYQRNYSSSLQTENNGIWTKIFPDSLMTASQFLMQFTQDEQPIWLLGDGLLYHKDKFEADAVRFMDEKYWSPRASNVFILGYEKALAGKFENPLTLTPNYLLRPNIKIKTR
ncbi:MAG: tRNA (adenosine(37)-N6)-threonylcarbamoyltransferase complex dimerization subunit type 1 TsaB [Planctomycetes bacterium]|nr:tRNA (adenosine(37)-N6)-threonylcarbamoyltransferase complex dimerization subunit type 1 TsaB [Planctomycetota bacterium]